MKGIFSFARNVNNWRGNNKSKLLPNSFPDIYQLYFTYYALYIGETEKKVLTRNIQYSSRKEKTVETFWTENGKAQVQLSIALNIMGSLTGKHLNVINWAKMSLMPSQRITESTSE